MTRIRKKITKKIKFFFLLWVIIFSFFGIGLISNTNTDMTRLIIENETPKMSGTYSELFSLKLGSNLHSYNLRIDDFNRDGQREFVIKEIENSTNQKLDFYGWNGSTFIKIQQFSLPSIATWGFVSGNVDDDENRELVIGTCKAATPVILIYEVNAAFEISLEYEIYPPLGDQENLFIFLGDFDNDLIDEISYCSNVNIESTGRYGIYNFNGTGYDEVFWGNDGPSWSHEVSGGDFDGDGIMEALFGFGYSN